MVVDSGVMEVMEVMEGGEVMEWDMVDMDVVVIVHIMIFGRIYFDTKKT